MKNTKSRQAQEAERNIIAKYMLLDLEDRARVQERINYLLEADKYTRPHFEVIGGKAIKGQPQTN